MFDYHKLLLRTHYLDVLYIEDDKAYAKEMLCILEDIFKEIHLAHDGEEGLNRYKLYYHEHQKYYDLVITDIQMPKINGIELVQNIYMLNQEQKIIILSAYPSAENLLSLVNLGVTSFLPKPYDVKQLFGVLDRITSKYFSVPIHNDIEHPTILLNETLTWDKQSSTLYENNVKIELTKNELYLIEMFVANGKKITTTDEILYTLSHHTPCVESLSTLKSIISRLRKKVPSLKIQNIYGLGYQLKF